MKRKKLLALVMAGAMVFGLAACGSSSSSGDSSSSKAEGIRLLNGKPEIDDQLQELAAKYEEETGNKVTIETIGGDTSASDELKKMYQADNMPDIFVIEANQAETWDGMLADLSDEDWVSDTSYALKDDDTVLTFLAKQESILQH